jgi:alpha-1,2-mannosyltransferase
MSHPAESISPERMRRPDARRFAILAAVCCLCGFAGWTFWVFLLGHELGQDFMVFHTAARAYFTGNLSLVYDGQRMTDDINAHFTAWLPRPLLFHPYLYPPHFLLLLLPFGVLPFGPSYLLFLLLTFAALVAATRCFVNRTDQRRLVVMSLLIFPQLPFALVTGQNSFLTASLLIGGFGLLDRNALVAGALLGLASYKPQFWLMVPFALIAARQWQAFISAAVTSALLVLTSVAVFGWDLWREWIVLMIAPSDAYQTWLVAGRLNGQSVYACAAWFGASPLVANIAQAVAALAGAACVYWSFRRCLPKDLNVAILLAATLLAAPHVSSQDGIMLAVAAIFLLCRALDDGFRASDVLLLASVWIAELCDPPIIFKLGAATPVVIGLFIAAVMTRARAMTGPLPAGQPH